MPVRVALQRRKSSYHYQTFPGVAPPVSRGRPPLHHSKDASNSSGPGRDGTGSGSSLRSALGDSTTLASTPIPKRQLTILTIISLAEQTALNSISPYLPQMAATFPEVDVGRVGLYVGVIASSFAAAQFVTNIFWGRLSDKVGRKPVILLGTLLTSLCFFAFGFCRTLAQAVMVQVLMGLVNANAGIVSTILGEITDKSNQASAFSWLPIVYGLGAITGPIIGGVLVDPAPNPHGSLKLFAEYPYLLPNLFSGALLLVEFVISLFMLDESLEEAQHLAPLGTRVKCLFAWLWQFTTSYWPPYLQVGWQRGREPDPPESLAEACPAMIPECPEGVPYHEILVPQIIFLMITYALFNLINIAFNSLYPIYAFAPRPMGRELSPKVIGLSLAFSGMVAIVFQAFLFTSIQTRCGNEWCYRFGFLGFVIAFLSMPLIGIDETAPRGVVWAELSVALLVKSVSTVGGLTCAMLLVTNASPKPSTLGSLNGLAQTLSAGGRAIGPLVSGALFTAGFKRRGGEWLAWGVFGGVAMLGLGISFALRRGKLEGGGDEAAGLLDGAEGGGGRGLR